MDATVRAPGRHRPLALIVDDDRDSRELYAHYLSIEGINTAEAHDGLQGLEKADSLLPDIIAVDLRLPRLDGVEVCRRLKQGARTRSIPLIAVTASGTGNDVEDAKRAGCVAVLIKPCLPETLLAEVRRILSLTEPAPL